MWMKKGLCFSKHHAQLPTVLPLDGRLRIFYSTKDEKNRSTIRAFEVDESDPTRIVRDDYLVLGLGQRGCFDDAGVMPSSVLHTPGGFHLYYTGWNLRQSVPYSQAIGRVYSRDGEVFERDSDGPILERNYFSPYLANSPVVVRDQESNLLRMYYCAGNGWQGDFPTYHISMAFSRDRKVWIPSAAVLVGEPGEAVSRVTFQGDRMWYGVKRSGSPYLLEYLEDRVRYPYDLRTPGDWDGEMTCYPCIYKDFMFYNGNGYGATGIGWAEWKNQGLAN